MKAPISQTRRGALFWFGAGALGVLCVTLPWWLLRGLPLAAYLEVTRWSGWLAVLCLACALCVSPLGRVLLRLSNHAPTQVAALRRRVGMTAAVLAWLHSGVGAVSLYDGVHGTLSWLWDTPHVRAGFAALILLFVLFLTSFPALVKRLRLRAWKELHRLAYVAFACAVQHMLLSPFAPRAWVVSLVAATLTIGLLRWVPARRSPPTTLTDP